jgi:hypothetical protein
MTTTLPALARAVHDVLAAGDTPEARERAAALLRGALADPAFVAAQFAQPVSERQIAYEDPQLGFCILLHEYHDARDGGPHDHGTSWAIYGQAEGETVMSDYEVVQPAAGGERGRVRKLRSYAMRPGDVHVYNEGAIHSPSRAGFSRLVRIEGRDLAKEKRGTYTVTAQA